MHDVWCPQSAHRPGDEVCVALEPIWWFEQSGRKECGASTLLTLAAFHRAPREGPPPATAQDDPPLIAGKASRWGGPGFRLKPEDVLSDWIQGDNLVKYQDWLTDPWGLCSGLRTAAQELGFEGLGLRWSPFSCPPDPDFYDGSDLAPTGLSRGAEETVLSRVVWQIANLHRPVALGFRSNVGLHWITVFGFRGERRGTRRIRVHSLLAVDPTAGGFELPVDAGHHLLERPSHNDIWQSQLLAVCCSARDDGNRTPEVGMVNLLPAISKRNVPLEEPDLHELTRWVPGGGRTERRNARRRWTARIRRHARHNLGVRHRLAALLDSPEHVLATPLPVWSERDACQHHLLPLVRKRGQGRSEVVVVARANDRGLVTHIHHPEVFDGFLATALDLGGGGQPAWCEHKALLGDPLPRVSLVWPSRPRADGTDSPVPILRRTASTGQATLVTHAGEPVELAARG